MDVTERVLPLLHNSETQTMATNKKTKGYTKSNIGKMDLMSMLKQRCKDPMFKDPNEPFEQWFNRKIEEQTKNIYEGTDEQGTNRKEDVQNPNPS